ncbi:MAG: T9SS type A sorting domain-containing protein [Bacteroidota bacterium]
MPLRTDIPGCPFPSWIAPPAMAQTPETSTGHTYTVRSLSWTSGLHAGSPEESRTRSAETVTFSEPGANWMRLHFGGFNLGPGSFLLITSLLDGAQQRLDQTSIEQWNHTSAVFNGSALRVDLHVSPSDEQAHVSIAELRAGRFSRQADAAEAGARLLATPLSCNGLDDRVASADPAVSRNFYDRGTPGSPNFYVGCTSWIGANGAHLAAGHCGIDRLTMIEFNVPPSGPDGVPVFAHPDDQYPVDLSSIVTTGSGQAEDWAVFEVFPNSNTGLLPEQVQGGYYRVSNETATSGNAVRVVGYGLDAVPAGTGTNPQPGPNADSQTLQEDVGSFGNSVGTRHSVSEVDIAIDNSGSPMIDVATNVSMGILTRGGALDVGAWGDVFRIMCSGGGQAFFSQALQDALNNLPGTNTVYVDASHPSPTEDGTVFDPYDTLAEGLSNTPAHGTLSIVEGAYPGTVTISNPIRITAPVGRVSIGGPGAPASVQPAPAALAADEARLSVPSSFMLNGNYPNPFNPDTRISFSIPETGRVVIVVYNVLGKEVVRLLDRDLAAGQHTVSFDGAGLPTGPYLYRVGWRDLSVSRMMLLLK